METLEKFEEDQKCLFCSENVVDELKFGKIYKYNDIITHYFCMLFSAEVEQNGSDTQGILGFLPEDIKKEKNRGDKIPCVYCRGLGATINCCVRGCKRKFHYSCGVETGSLHQFFDHFKSYCVTHRKVQNVPPSPEKHTCLICYDEVKAKPSLNTIWAPCCKTAWFHRSCIQKMALNGGYFFRCPKCNNNDVFRNEMLECGVYIPDQDASWELDPQAYDDLGHRHNVCDAELCRCPEGRTYRSMGTWELLLCHLCGSQGTHFPCSKITIDQVGEWTCPTCSAVTKQSVHVSSEASPEPNAVRARMRPRLKKNRRTVRRNRSRSKDESPVSRPTRVLNSNSSDDSDSELTNVNSSRVNKTSILWEDTEDDDSDEEESRNTNRVENQPLIVVPKRLSQPNCPVVDLDSDDDVPSRTTCENIPSENNVVSSTSVDDYIILDDDNGEDDVVFVSLKKDDYDDLPQPTARLEFVQNNKVFIVSPNDVRRIGIEKLASSFNSSASPVEATKPPPTSSAPMWQPTPLHESVIHSPVTSETVQTFNPVISNFCSLNKELRKTNSASDPKEPAVICID